MRFAFNDEQTMLREMLAAALAREVPPDKLRAWSDAGDFAAFDALVNENGWARFGVDDAIGGQGGGLLEQALLFEALGHHAAPSGGVSAQVAALMMAASAQLPAALMSNLIGAAPALVFDVRAALDVAVAARSVLADNAVLNGQIGHALIASCDAFTREPRLIIVAEDDGAGLWQVAAGAAGLYVTPRRMVDRTRLLADIDLRAVPAQRIGHLTRSALTQSNARLALLVAAESLGLARRMLAMTTAYATQRVQFGVPIGSFQAVKHEAAQMLVDIEAAHSGVYYAAWALDESDRNDQNDASGDALMHAWIAKSFVCETAARTADRALMLHGAIGYTLDYELQFYFKRAKLNVELLGSPRHYRERIASALALLPTPTLNG
jgi:alkylation response protein AidB-like acyl-CoA dehydrogenase